MGDTQKLDMHWIVIGIIAFFCKSVMCIDTFENKFSEEGIKDDLLEQNALPDLDLEIPSHSKKIPFEPFDPDKLSKERVSSAVKGRLTCLDVLSGMVSMPPDADVNLVCQNCYTFCMMELVLLQYLKNQKREGLLTDDKDQEIQTHLSVIQELIPGFLDSCAAAFWAFKSGSLREQLNRMQQEVQQNSGQIIPLTNE